MEMNPSLKVGIIGDFNSNRYSQIKTNEALTAAAQALSVTTEINWLPTKSIEKHFVSSESTEFHAILGGPGDYENPNGAINAIRFCRERDWPFLGT